jgi:retinol dehydrogenase 12
MKSPKEGAQTTLQLALEETDKIKKGEYYFDCKAKATTPFSSSLENAERLWKITERELGI